jgi:hypothetical protein
MRFLVDNSGSWSILITLGRSRPEVTLPVDGTKLVSYSCFIDIAHFINETPRISSSCE